MFKKEKDSEAPAAKPKKVDFSALGWKYVPPEPHAEYVPLIHSQAAAIRAGLAKHPKVKREDREARFRKACEEAIQECDLRLPDLVDSADYKTVAAFLKAKH